MCNGCGIHTSPTHVHEANNVEYDENGKDKDRRPILDSGASHCITPYISDLINIIMKDFGTLRGVTGTTKINKEQW